MAWKACFALPRDRQLQVDYLSIGSAMDSRRDVPNDMMLLNYPIAGVFAHRFRHQTAAQLAYPCFGSELDSSVC